MSTSTPATVPDRRNRSALRVCVALIAVSLPHTPLCGCATQRGTIGAILAPQDDGRILVHDAPRELAAARAGLLPGDEILLIDGQDVRAFDEKQLRAALSGDVGEPIALTVIRGDQVLRVTVKRTPSRHYPIPSD